MPAPFIPLHIRYERHIKRTKTCWLWQGSGNQAGYGQFRVGRTGPVMSVHRWAYEHFKGPIPPGLLVLHTCDNPGCSNPDHLYAGTAKDNARDMTVRGRRAKTYKFGPRMGKLTDTQVRKIRKDTRPAYIIARAFKIGESHVFAIKARTRKAHVPDETIFDELQNNC